MNTPPIVSPEEWEASRRLVEAGRFIPTLKRLIEEVQRIELPPAVRDSIVVALKQGEAERIHALAGRHQGA